MAGPFLDRAEPMNPESARGLRQIGYTVVLILFLKGCTGILDAQSNSLSANTSAIRVEVSPRLQMAGLGKSATVLIRVTTPRSPQNRAVCVVVDGPTYRSSCWDNGPESPLRKELTYKGLSAGEYGVVGVLEWVEKGSGARKTSTARDTFVITDGQSTEF